MKEALDKAEAEKEAAEKAAKEAIKKQNELENANLLQEAKNNALIKKLRQDMEEATQKQRVAEAAAEEEQRQREK